jgi:hypothetical protein
MKLLLLSLCVLLSLGDRIPEFKTSLSFKGLKVLRDNVLQPMIDPLLKDIDLPIKLDLKKVLKYVFYT